MEFLRARLADPIGEGSDATDCWGSGEYHNCFQWSEWHEKTIASQLAILDEYERIELSKDEYPNAVNFASWMAMTFCVKQIAKQYAGHPDCMALWVS